MTRNRTFLFAKALLLVMAATPAAAVPALAQEPPVFPILYGGTVYVDGQPAPEGAVLVVKVGGWQNRTTVERNGTYHGLMAAPPTKEYYSRPITFHLEEMTAQEQDVFLPAGGPIFKDRGYDLHFSRAPQPAATTSATATALPSPTTLPRPSPTPETSTPTDGGTRSQASNARLVRAVVLGAALLVAGAWYVLVRRRSR